MLITRRKLTAAVVAAMLAACGDGDSSSGGGGVVPPTGTQPVAVAGPDRETDMGTQVVLDGSASSDPQGTALQYTWTLVAKPTGSTAVLAGANQAQPTFTADVDGLYQAELVVSDGAERSAPATVKVTANTVFKGGTVSATSPTVSGELPAIAARVDAVLAFCAARGYNTMGPDALLKALLGKDQANPADSIFLLDTREPVDFAKGHVPGSVNVPLRDLPSLLLARRDFIPEKNVVVIGYNGGDGNMASLLVNLMRLPDTLTGEVPPHKWSKALFAGISSWSFDRQLSPYRFDDDLGVNRIADGALTTAPVAKVDAAKFPAFAEFTGQADTMAEKILVRAREFLRAAPDQSALTTNFRAVTALLADADPSNDPQLLSVRGAADYAKGHPAAAINFGWAATAKLDVNTKFVDPTRPVAVYCYTGHTGALATMALGILGYKAQNLVYGLNGYTTNGTVLGAATNLRNFDLQRTWDFPLKRADGGPDTLVGYTVPSQGCVGCHTNLGALLVNQTPPPPADPNAPASEGEG